MQQWHIRAQAAKADLERPFDENQRLLPVHMKGNACLGSFLSGLGRCLRDGGVIGGGLWIDLDPPKRSWVDLISVWGPKNGQELS